MQVNNSIFCSIILALGAGVFTGCSKLALRDQPSSSEHSFFDRLPWRSKSDAQPEPYPNPVKVAATWTPDTLVQTGRVPTRGFGGRIFFYDEKSRAVPVDGTLIVHGFDDADNATEKSVKRFEFTPEQFTRHFSQSDLGASYSVWIPWDAIGGEQRRISLVTSFRTVEGKTVQGVPATVLLPGATKAPTEAEEVAKTSPQYQRYLKAARSATTPRSGLTTTTIARRIPQRKMGTIAVSKPVSDRASPIVGNTSSRGHGTPSFELPIKSGTRQTRVMPANAEIPMEWSSQMN